MKKRILILLGILIIGGGAAGVCWKTGVFGQQEVSGDVIYVTLISEINGDAAGVSIDLTDQWIQLQICRHGRTAGNG